MLFDRCKLEVLDRIDCKYLPVKMSIDIPNVNNIECNDLIDNTVVRVQKYRWMDENKPIYVDNLAKESFKVLLNDAMSCIYININVALNKFNDCVKDAALCMKTVTVLNKKKVQQWFDYECVTKRREVRKLLRNLN